MKLTVQTFFKQFPDDESCLSHLFDVRFGQGHVCPKCERSAKWYRIKAERGEATTKLTDLSMEQEEDDGFGNYRR